MKFQVQIFLTSLRRRKALLWLALLPPLIYLGICAALPSSYTISREITASPTTLLALGQNPRETVRLEAYLLKPATFFADNLALMELRDHLLTSPDISRPEWEEWLPSRFSIFIKRAVTQDLAFTDQGNGALTLAYHGPDRQLGLSLVDFYAQRVKQGADRARERALVPGLQGEASPPVTLGGQAEIASQRTVFDAARICTALTLAIASLVVILLAIWLAEAINPRILTARQAAEQLQTEVLGIIPDVGELHGLLGPGKDARA